MAGTIPHLNSLWFSGGPRVNGQKFFLVNELCGVSLHLCTHVIIGLGIIYMYRERGEEEEEKGEEERGGREGETGICIAEIEIHDRDRDRVYTCARS